MHCKLWFVIVHNARSLSDYYFSYWSNEYAKISFIFVTLNFFILSLLFQWGFMSLVEFFYLSGTAFSHLMFTLTLNPVRMYLYRGRDAISFIGWMFWNWVTCSVGSVSDKILYTLQIFAHLWKNKIFEKSWIYPFLYDACWDDFSAQETIWVMFYFGIRWFS